MGCLSAAWATASWLSARVGFWVGMGSAAIVLGVLALALDRSVRAAFRFSAAGAAAGLVAGVALAVGCWLFYQPLIDLVPRAAQDKSGLDARFAALSPRIAALLLPVVISGEEIVWRGTIHGCLASQLSAGSSIVVGAVLYAATTWLCGSPLLAIMALVGGLLWAALREGTDDLAAPIVCHLTWALLVLFVRPIRAL